MLPDSESAGDWLDALAEATTSFAARVGDSRAIATSADSGPTLMPGCTVKLPASWPPIISLEVTVENVVLTELKFCRRTLSCQLPSACTANCWMLARGGLIRFFGPDEHAPSKARNAMTSTVFMMRDI